MAGGVHESVHLCVCHSLYKSCVYKPDDTLRRSPLQKVCFSLAGRSCAGRAISACLVESNNSINNNERSSSSHNQTWAQRGQASYPRSHSRCKTEPELKPKSIQPQIHQDTGLLPSQSHSMMCCSNKSLALSSPTSPPGLINGSLKCDL